MLRAIIFDFDGVVADSEPTHMAVFQRVLGEFGIFLGKEEYFARYLGYDDKGCFEAMLKDHERPAPPHVIADLVNRKAQIFLNDLKEHLVIYPGVRELVREASPRYSLAVASGALRHEIEFVLEHAGIRKEFLHITSAEDVTRGKPDPQSFLHALHHLNQLSPADGDPLQAEDCLVIEDSIPGVHAGRSAGMKVLAVTNTHPADQLVHADWVVESLTEITLKDLSARLWGDQ